MFKIVNITRMLNGKFNLKVKMVNVILVSKVIYYFDEKGECQKW